MSDSAKERKTRLAVLDAAIVRGVADADAGRVKPASEVFDEMETRLNANAQPVGRNSEA